MEREHTSSKPWHSKDISEVLKELNVTEAGLSNEEAQKRLQQYGSNELKKEKRKSPIIMFLEQFTDILMIILLVAVGLSIVTYFLKDYEVSELYDAAVIIAIVMATA
ncbi:MAG: cation-transporting P-type ATPase, partial [Candidatus Bathyarchaeia archaeon]